jgi:dUTP pyrophosphatase
MSLYIQVDNVELRRYVFDYVNTRRFTDSGFDIPMFGTNVQLNTPMHTFNLGIKVAAVDENNKPMPCILIPRSSLASTPFRLANSIGLIDAGYRGEVKAKVDIIQQDDVCTIEHRARLFQICQSNFMPWKNVIIVQMENELPAAPDNRGAGGFGSTN